MHTMREFSRRLSHFKRMAESGKTITLKDRQGKRFTFRADKPRGFLGAGKDLKAKPLPPIRIGPEEFGDNY